VDLIVTSPPYYGLRSYTDGGEHYDGQIGSEATPGEYVAALVACTREWVRVLKPSGSLFVNLGDKYSTGNGGDSNLTALGQRLGTGGGQKSDRSKLRQLPVKGLPQKSLLGLPWRYALAVCDQLGLILRAEIVWAKPNGLPESVTDRVRRAHEQVFHFTRQPRYYSAVDEIREGIGDGTRARWGSDFSRRDNGYRPALNQSGQGESTMGCHPLGKLPGSVWTIPSAPLVVPARLGVDHFAAFPPALVRPIVLGWSPPGVCTACGEGRRPVVDKGQRFPVEDFAHRKRPVGKPIGPMDRGEHSQWLTGSVACASGQEWNRHKAQHPDTITGYACACARPDAPTRPAVVLDPFGGTGTTALVATVHGRHGITIDASSDYCRLAAWRCQDPGERARALDVPRPPVVPDDQVALFDV
jgi:DNA modification methylase